MGHQARIRALRKTIKDIAEEKKTTPDQIANAIYNNHSRPSKRNSDESLAAWYFIKKGFIR